MYRFVFLRITHRKSELKAVTVTDGKIAIFLA